MIVKDKKSIEPGTGINVGCANMGVMQHKGVAKLPFDNLPTGTEAVKIFHRMHSPLLGGGKFVKEGICTLVFGRKNAHIVKGQTGTLVQHKIKQAEEKNKEDIVMTVSFDEKKLTWKTDAMGKAKPLFNIASNVHRIRSKEVLCDYLHQAARYLVK